MSDKFALVTKGHSEFFSNIEDALIASKKLHCRLRIIRTSDGVMMAWRGPWKENGSYGVQDDPPPASATATEDPDERKPTKMYEGRE